MKNYKPLYDQFLEMFNLMKKDNGFHRNQDVLDRRARTTSVFWPVAVGPADPEIGALKSITCGGATGGTGINGHTLVRINMHAWFGTPRPQLRQGGPQPVLPRLHDQDPLQLHDAARSTTGCTTAPARG